MFEAWCCTEEGNVKGLLSLNKFMLVFDVYFDETGKVISESNMCKLAPGEFQLCIDLADISDVSLMDLPSSYSKYIKYKKCPRDFFLNIDIVETDEYKNGHIPKSSVCFKITPETTKEHPERPAANAKKIKTMILSYILQAVMYENVSSSTKVPFSH